MKNLSIISLCVVLFLSCAGRKVNQIKKEIQVSAIEYTQSKEIHSNTIVKEADISTVIYVDTNEISIIPVNAGLPIIITDNKGNEKSYQNAVINYKKVIAAADNKMYSGETNHSVTILEAKENAETVISETEKIKNTEKKNSWYWWFLLVPGIVMILFYLKHKKQ